STCGASSTIAVAVIRLPLVVADHPDVSQRQGCVACLARGSYALEQLASREEPVPTMTPPTIPNLFSEDVTEDPYRAYRTLRSLGPVYDEANDLWILSRHADVLEALHHPAVFSSAGGYGQFMSGGIGPAGGSERAGVLGFDQVGGSRVLIASDPPDHTMLRRIVSRPFTKRRIAEWDEMARRLAATLVDELVERIRGDDVADFTMDLAVPLPVTLIAEILGIP